MISHFLSGDLVRSDRPVKSHLPADEAQRIGIVLGHVPGRERGNPFGCAAVQVMWFGPRHGHPFVTIEVDHRLVHV